MALDGRSAMRRRSAWSTAGSGDGPRTSGPAWSRPAPPCCGLHEAPAGDRFTLDGDGRLAIALGPGAPANATVLNATGDITLSRVVFAADDGVPVIAYVAAPPDPKAAIVYVPGANEPVSGHTQRFRTFADAGIAFLYLDARGNGFETPGEPFDRSDELNRLRQDRWPQSYRVVADAMHARAYLAADVRRSRLGRRLFERRPVRGDRSRHRPGLRRVRRGLDLGHQRRAHVRGRLAALHGLARPGCVPSARSARARSSSTTPKSIRSSRSRTAGRSSKRRRSRRRS